MRTLRFIGTASLAVLLSFSIISCADEEDAPIVLDSTVLPTIAEQITDLDISNVDASVTKLSGKVIEVQSDSNAPVSKIVGGYNEDCLVFFDNSDSQYSQQQTRASHTDLYAVLYTVSTVKDNGSLLLTPSSLETFASILPTISLALNADGSFTVIVADVTYQTTTISESSIPASKVEMSLFRTWVEPMYNASVKCDNLPLYGASGEPETKTIAELKKLVIDRLQTEKGIDDKDFKILTADITKVTFSLEGKNNNRDGIVTIVYADNTVETSDWRWIDKMNAKLETTVDGERVEMSVRFKADGSASTNDVYFVFSANLDGIDGLANHTISGQLICHMHD